MRSIYGAKGNGKRVGVISNGVNNISLSQQSGDIPSGVHILNDAAGGGNEGTAMLEILYDLAPNAEYYFHATGLRVGHLKIHSSMQWMNLLK